MVVRTIKNVCGWVAGCVLLGSAGACVQMDALQVMVAAGATGRCAAPVSVEVDWPTAAEPGAATVMADNKTDDAQIELLANNKARIWWMVDDLPAEQTRTYAVNLHASTRGQAATSFAWKDSSANGVKSMDLLYGQRPVLRYMYTPFDPANIEATKKPYHHVFDPDGSRLITKGAGGKYPHHRGIFFGYRKCHIGKGQPVDTWHARKGECTVHRKVLKEYAGPVFGGHEVLIDWKDCQGKTFIEETRRVVAFRQPDGQILIEFASTLRPTRGPVRLEGDRHHAGVQFRAAQEVADNESGTRYLRPAAWRDVSTTQAVDEPDYKDLPWDVVQYKLADRAYTVAYLTDPANPANAEFSERPYGRFGEYFPWDLRADHPLTVRYRWWITATQNVSRDAIQSKYEDLATPPQAVAK